MVVHHGGILVPTTYFCKLVREKKYRPPPKIRMNKIDGGLT